MNKLPLFITSLTIIQWSEWMINSSMTKGEHNRRFYLCKYQSRWYNAVEWQDSIVLKVMDTWRRALRVGRVLECWLCLVSWFGCWFPDWGDLRLRWCHCLKPIFCFLSWCIYQYFPFSSRVAVGYETSLYKILGGNLVSLILTTGSK